MSTVNTNDGYVAVTKGFAYLQEVKLLSADDSPKSGKAKKQRQFLVVKLAMHNGKRQDGKLAYIYPECGITDDLKEMIEQLQARLDTNPDDRIACRVEIANLRGTPWFDAGKSGVNYRGTLRGMSLVQEDDDGAE